VQVRGLFAAHLGSPSLEGVSATTSPSGSAAPILPEYTGRCITNVVHALLSRVLGRDGDAADLELLPGSARGASQIALLVLDGLGWEQLRARAALAPTLSAADGIGDPITSVVPTTTATALTSITTGRTPAEHGVLGYRIAVDDEILNVLRWTLGSGRFRDARRLLPPRDYQPFTPFAECGGQVPVVSKHEFGGTGFTAVHLGAAPLHGYRVLSSLPLTVGNLLREGEPFVYAYYDGIDKIAHASGLGDLYDAELRAVDRLIGDIVAELPPGAVLVVTADHGELDIGPNLELLGREIMGATRFLSGEGRFRWLHARDGAAKDLYEMSAERYADSTWVRARDELLDEGWLGGPLREDLLARLGDVALVPFAPIAFVDPADTGESRLQSRHGSLTAAEMYVPLVALGGEEP
jgi:predicted AlkP superfamily pyrophosphatase or phosphodiesterase